MRLVQKGLHVHSESGHLSSAAPKTVEWVTDARARRSRECLAANHVTSKRDGAVSQCDPGARAKLNEVTSPVCRRGQTLDASRIVMEACPPGVSRSDDTPCAGHVCMPLYKVGPVIPRMSDCLRHKLCVTLLTARQLIGHAAFVISDFYRLVAIHPFGVGTVVQCYITSHLRQG